MSSRDSKEFQMYLMFLQKVKRIYCTKYISNHTICEGSLSNISSVRYADFSSAVLNVTTSAIQIRCVNV